MARTNLKPTPIVTHEGGRAIPINPEQQLRRSLMSCLLWESEFYEDGQSIGARIIKTVPLVSPGVVAAMALEARERMKLRHAPLLLVREMARIPSHRPLVATTLATIIQRADELSEFVALYWRDGKQPLSAQVKKGLAAAFQKFDAYELAKWNRDGAVKLRDVLFLCHAKPKDVAQDILWKKLIEGKLPTPDTWEVGLSAAKSEADKRGVWLNLLEGRKLGALALLRNLRNMDGVGVPADKVRLALFAANVSRVLPFRFIAAARYMPRLELDLEQALFRSLAEKAKLPGETTILVDVSGSMTQPLSEKSDMKRMDAACGVAMCARELCEAVRVFSFSEGLVEVPVRRGFALRDAITDSQPHRNTYLGAAIQHLPPYSRLVVITDEQAHDRVPAPAPKSKGYIINVASAENGVGYRQWTHIDGFSEAVLDYILEREVGSLSQGATTQEREDREE